MTFSTVQSTTKKKFKLYCLWLLLLVFFLGAKAQAGEMVLIPGGKFEMGSDKGEPDERPVHTVYVDAFYLDRYPVTNADYARFLNACGNRKEGGKKWLDTDSLFSWWLCKIKFKNGRFIPKSGYENHPVVKVSWHGARAYASWAGKRLPTEAEWEKAARGGLKGRNYVYGNNLSPEQANVKGLQATYPIGLYPPNGFGLYDMAASVWQWCSDWYDPAYYARSPRQNPKGAETGSLKVLRGGSWFHEGSWRVSSRGADTPASDNFCFATGFRCAKDVDKDVKLPQRTRRSQSF
ncbi:MAG: formylglycine-generating enzyme family protein [Deltaproteobacteria bacterium]|nr:formylglycine-generating enzyme family protein [Deltaproteobacteria bacterium]